MGILMNLHTAIAGYFYIVILILFAKVKRLELLTTKIFRALIFLTNINLILNIALYYVFYYAEKIPHSLGNAIIKIYLITIVMVVAGHCIYNIKMCVRSYKLSVYEWVLAVLPEILVMLAAIFSEIHWERVEQKIYMHGLCIYLVDITILFYSIHLLIFHFKFWKKFTKKIKMAVALGGVIWLIGFSSQALTSVFIDMIGTTLILLMFVYFVCFENTNEIVDDKTGLFNKRGFLLMADEYRASKKEYLVVNVGLDGLEYVRNQFGLDAANEILVNMEQKIEEILKRPVFLFKDSDILLLFFQDSTEIEKFQNLPPSYLSQNWKINETNVTIEARINIIDSKLIQSKNIIDILNYITSKRFRTENDKQVIIVDEQIIRKEERQKEIQVILQSAIRNDGFMVYFQPIYDAKTNSFSTCEALVRLKDTETLGFISPEEFIPIAENYGLISQIGQIVFEKVCEFAEKQKLNEYGVQYVEVNLSALQAIDGELYAQLMNCLLKHHLSPDFINLEITESVNITSQRMLRENMRRLKAKGISFSMDDFGTGYSNLAQISNLGYDIIKLDKSLIWPCFKENGECAMIILKNMIMMIHELGMKIIAEGIETREQANKMLEFGVSLHQGYLYSKPLCMDDYFAFLKENNT